LIGTLSMNLTGVPRTLGGNAGDRTTFVARLFNAISILVPRARMFDMSIKNCNKERWVSVQNHNKNELSLGQLQVPDHTTLVFNETAMDSGTLGPKGVLNVRDLGLLIKDQAVSYDYEYHGLQFHTNAQILYLSEGKPIVKCDLSFKVQPEGPDASATPAGAPSANPELDNLLSAMMSGGGGKEEASETPIADLAKKHAGRLESWRRYLLLCRLLAPRATLDEPTQRFAGVDWVAMRKRDKTVTQEVLHLRMTLARALTISHGETIVSVDRYNQMRNLEDLRMARYPKPAPATEEAKAAASTEE